MKEISDDLYNELEKLGIIDSSNIRDYNEGASNYSEHIIQPWSIWKEYNLDPWDADIIKRILRIKKGESKVLDYKKIIHIANEKIRQINNNIEI